MRLITRLSHPTVQNKTTDHIIIKKLFFFRMKIHYCVILILFCSNSCDNEEHHYDYSNMGMPSCKLSKTMIVVVGLLFVMVACLATTTLVLTKRVRFLGRRPRIKKRIVVNKSITPMQSCRPPQQQNQQCEITIENCCNMNICETVNIIFLAFRVMPATHLFSPNTSCSISYSLPFLHLLHIFLNNF